MSTPHALANPWLLAHSLGAHWNRIALATVRVIIPPAAVAASQTPPVTPAHEDNPPAEDVETTMAHELRTPLTSIRALSEILRDNPDLDPDQIYRFLEIICQESEKLCKNVEDALEILEIERKRGAATRREAEPTA